MAAFPTELFLDIVAAATQSFAIVGTAIDALKGLPTQVEGMKYAHELVELRTGKPADRGDLDMWESGVHLMTAQREKGFPLLCGMAVVALWSELEAFVEDVCVQLVVERPDTLNAEKLGKLTAPVVDFIGVNDADRGRILIDLLQRKIGRKPGVAQFDELLLHLGAGGKVEDSIRRDLVEMRAVRNVVAHRRGKADPVFKDACDWIPIELGAIVPIGERDLARYIYAVDMYAADVAKRILVILGEDTSAVADFAAEFIEPYRTAYDKKGSPS